MICTKFDWFWIFGSGEDFLKKKILCFHSFAIRDNPFPLNKREPPSLKDNLWQVWSILAQWFWRRFSNDTTPILHFLWLSPLWRGPGPIFKQIEFPLPEDNLYQVWLNLACWIWRIFLKKIVSVFLLFCNCLLFEKGYPLRLNKPESPSPKDDLCQVWLKLVQWFWRRNRKSKSLQTDKETVAGQQAIRIAHLSFQLRWTINHCFLNISEREDGWAVCEVCMILATIRV
jgi:hypothetical protein